MWGMLGGGSAGQPGIAMMRGASSGGLPLSVSSSATTSPRPGDRGFESRPLQRRVSRETEFFRLLAAYAVNADPLQVHPAVSPSGAWACSDDSLALAQPLQDRAPPPGPA